ncbi:DUF6127 family protein [Roseococcus thiosulfatophilus]|uniref:DUF6127 family protein n=1 Tax=Roseococcus thiosulfatophilus TaxID=35813 RepID=UPI001A8EC25C|nr:DUF6127 family protein [Roseococcus thiosulfatophilus]
MDLPGRQMADDPLLTAMVDRAADRAAKQAVRQTLERLGLHDEDAGADVRDLRGLLRDFREARRTFWQTVTRLTATAFLAALVAGAAMLFWRHDR